MVKAVLIDLDGTLVDTTPALYQVYLKFLERYGHKGNEEEFKSLIGPSIHEIVAILQKKYQLVGSHEELSTMYVTLIMLQGFEGTQLFPNVEQFLDYAKKSGLKLAIVTSGTQALVKTCLEPLGIYDKFDAIITSEDVEKSKPSPEIYKEALKKLKIKNSEAIAIEDSEMGAESAKKADLKVLMITHGRPKEHEVDGVTYVDDWKEIDKCLKSS